MTDHTARVRTKGLDGTGCTEELAAEMHSRRGAHYMAIVEVKVDAIHETSDGKRSVDLVITQFEPAAAQGPMADQLDSHLRNLTRTTYQNRALHADDQQLQIDTQDDLEPTVEQVVAAGRGLELAPEDLDDDEDPDDEHDEDTDEDTDVVPIEEPAGEQPPWP
ncbi:hypothetical protein, partial [Nocardioides sp. AX2bis]|uniref:hypothetical protein n=1 Tax=Nocardioides sp. AX2bis TaxID=2653157 RepID=UPI001916B2CD